MRSIAHKVDGVLSSDSSFTWINFSHIKLLRARPGSKLGLITRFSLWDCDKWDSVAVSKQVLWTVAVPATQFSLSAPGHAKYVPSVPTRFRRWELAFTLFGAEIHTSEELIQTFLGGHRRQTAFPSFPFNFCFGYFLKFVGKSRTQLETIGCWRHHS